MLFQFRLVWQKPYHTCAPLRARPLAPHHG
jgi:hypothetical protein